MESQIHKQIPNAQQRHIWKEYLKYNPTRFENIFYDNETIALILVLSWTNKSIKHSREYKVDYAYVVVGDIEKDLRVIQQRKKSQ